MYVYNLNEKNKIISKRKTISKKNEKNIEKPISKKSYFSWFFIVFLIFFEIVFLFDFFLNSNYIHTWF